MSCNCINEKEKFIREQLSSQNEEWKDRKVIDVSIENGMWLFGNRGRRVFSPITIEYEGKNKKNELKIKKEHSNLLYSYCPFCGQKYDDEEKKG